MAPSKRTRTSRNKATTQADPIPVVPSALMSIPLELIYEILHLFSPPMLLSMARVNKFFRRMLMTRTTMTVARWKDALARTNAPPRPTDMSEPAWANLMCGKECFVCGDWKWVELNLWLRRRLCSRCLEKGLIDRAKFRRNRKFAKYDVDIFKMLPSETRRGKTSYWEPDLHDMHDQLLKYKEDAMKQDVDVEQAVQQFKDTKVASAQAILDHAQAVKNYYANRQYERYLKKEKRKTILWPQILERLAALGWPSKDLGRLHTWRYDDFLADVLTDSVWEQILPRLEAEIHETRLSYMRGRQSSRSCSRTRAVTQLYHAFRAAQPPLQWAQLPDITVVLADEAIARVVNEPVAAETDPTELDEDAARQLPLEIARAVVEWLDTKRAALAELLAPPNHTPATNDSFDLATTAVVCLKRHAHAERQPALFGLEDIMAHHCGADWQPASGPPLNAIFALSVPGAAAAAALVPDPAHASWRAMDAADARFVCMSCRDPAPLQRQAMTWRQCVDHAVAEGDAHGVESWRRLGVDEEADVKRREVLDPVIEEKCWACAHCPEHIDQQETRRVVLRHLTNEHAIGSALDGQDVFIVPAARTRFPDTVDLYETGRVTRAMRAKSSRA